MYTTHSSNLHLMPPLQPPCHHNYGQQMVKLNPTPLVTPPTIDDNPSLNPTWSHHVWVATGCTTVLFSLAYAIYGSTDSYTWLKTIVVGFIAYLLADLASGVYHWVFDNYGNVSTPIIGSFIDTFQHHHKVPLAITKRHFSINLYSAGRIITFVVPPINLIWHDQPAMMGFVGIFSGCFLFTVQTHVWGHVSKSKLPAIVVALQDAGVVLSPSRHAPHHRSFNRSYCIVSGVWNRVLDEYKVFEGLEKVVFFVFGVQPRWWSDANSGGTVAEGYFETSPP